MLFTRDLFYEGHLLGLIKDCNSKFDTQSATGILLQ